MRKIKWFQLLLVAVLAIGMILSGCSSGKKGGSQSNSITINLGSEPPQMNSILTTDATSMNVMRHVLEGLTRLDQNSNPIPGVAERWETSDDGLTWKFYLRKNSKWSNGTPVTAKDFEFAFKEVLNPDSGAEYAYIMYCFKNGQAYNEGKVSADEVGVKALDEYTLELTLERPTPYLLDLLAFGVFSPVNEEYYKAQEGKYATEASNMLYNGPWIIKEWAHDDKIVLVKNENYWNKDEIKLEQITMLMVNDNNTSLNMFLANELDMTGIRGDQIETVKKEGYQPLNYSDGAVAYFEFNLQDPILKNVNIRKALTYAIDRKTFVEKVLQGSSLPALSFTNPVIKGENKSFKEEVGDILKDNNSEEAKALLQKGMEELGLTEIPKISFIADDSDTAKKAAQAYQEAWKKNLGIDVEIVTLPFKARLERMSNKDFQIVLALWGPDYNDPMTYLDMFETGNGNNHTSYSSEKYDQLLAQIRDETNNSKRFALLRELENLLMEDLPVGPIYFRMRDYVVKPHLKGVVRDAFQDINLYWAYVEK